MKNHARVLTMLAGWITTGFLLGNHTEPTDQAKIEPLGIPIRAVMYGNSHGVLAKSPAGADGMFYIGYYASTCSALLGIQPTTGESVRIPLGSKGGYGCAVAPDGAIYVGGVGPGDLYRYAPRANQLAKLGGSELGAQYLWDTVVASNGKVYSGAYPNGSVLEYDPAAGKMRDLGRLVPKSEYARAIGADASGQIWVGTGTGGAHLIVCDPVTGVRRDVLPEPFRNSSVVQDLQVSGDYVFCALLLPGHLLVFDAKTQRFLREIPLPAGESYWVCGNSGAGGVCYPCTAPGGDLYRYDAKSDQLKLLAEALGQVEVVVDERYAHVINDQDYLYYDLVERKPLFRKRLEPAGDGMDIYALVAGGDGNIYGSTFINQHIFRYLPADGTLADLGKVIRWCGQVDSMHAGRDGRLYMGSYVYANISRYDPAQPWRPSRNPDGNPREIGPVGGGQYRTRSIVLGPDRNVYLGTLPAYDSAATGSFARWNATTDEIVCWTDLVPGGTVAGLRADDQWLYGYGGGEFFVLDVHKMKKSFVAKLDPTAIEIDGAGKVLLSVGAEIVLFDPAAMKLLAPLKNPAGALTAMTRLPDGRVAGINDQAIMAIDARRGAVRTIANEGGKFLACDRAGCLYFARGPTLYRLTR